MQTIDEAPELIHEPREKRDLPAVAIIGMSGRFPGAGSVEEFWQNLVGAKHAMEPFSWDAIEARDAERDDPRYVRVRPVLQNVDQFDAAFFDIYPREAQLMDPQHRIFLEVCWEALERAGYDPFRYPGAVGMYAGASPSTYLISNILHDREAVDDFAGKFQIGNYTMMVGNAGDFVPTRVSYKLNLRGPSVNVQCACSTSLVAIAQAAQSLLTYGCDMALAGGVSITFPQQRGYCGQDGGMVSEEGRCRPFEARSNGTVFGHGAGVVLLKRLDDAMADRDPILAVLRGFGVNNDGGTKAGYTAPSVSGQADAIQMAHVMSGIPVETISYVEAHGTGTQMGDPIELRGLNEAFRRSTNAEGFCLLGSVKGHIGHLDVAAGVSGVIKTVLQMQHNEIVPVLDLENPNPRLELAGSPFRLAAKRTPWVGGSYPRRAGVSAFGVGGTNSHVVLEEAPPASPASPSSVPQLLIWSAKTPTALERMTSDFRAFRGSHPEQLLEDCAYTLQVGRSRHRERAFLVANGDAALPEQTPISATLSGNESGNIVFLFPGQGSQTVDMAKGLYRTYGVFRQAFDQCAEILSSEIQPGLPEIVYPASGTPDASTRLNRTEFTQPALFAVEYALAKLWMSWGIAPAAMAGHSIGEYVAAHLAGVMSLEDSVAIVAARGRLMQGCEPGAMLAVRASAEAVAPYLSAEVDIAAKNTPQSTVVSGSFAAIEQLEQRLTAAGLMHRRVATSHAFHSRMMEPALNDFEAVVAGCRLSPPLVPIVSTMTGRPLSGDEAQSAHYWREQLRQPVCFRDAIQTLRHSYPGIFLEVGPGETLAKFTRQICLPEMPPVLASLAKPDESATDEAAIVDALGRLWLAGSEPDWEAFHAPAQPRRVMLPTYPFERKSFWIAPPQKAGDLPTETSNVQVAATRAAEEISMASARRDAILKEVLAVFGELSGTDAAAANPDATFLELGFDSLFLTQFSQEIQRKFKVKLTLRQLMDAANSPAALTSHLEQALPPTAFAPEIPAPMVAAPVAPPPAPAAPVLAAPAPASITPAIQNPVPMQAPVAGGSFDQLAALQMQTMAAIFAKQLEALGAAPAAPAATVAATPAASGHQVVQPTPSEPGPAPVEAPKAFGPFKPFARQQNTDLTEKQREGLSTFIERYNRKTAGSKSRTQDHRGVLADPRAASGFKQQWKNVVYPIVSKRSRGAYVWDVDDNRYIDIMSGFGSIYFGHNPDFVRKALAEQIELGFEIGPQSHLTHEVARLFREFTGKDRVAFCNTGSEAVMAAIRIARTVTGRKKIVMFAGSYHGTIDEVLAKSAGRRAMPIAPGIPREATENVLIFDYGTPETLEKLKGQMDDVAAIVVEPVQSRHPEIQPKEFLHELRALTKAAGTALIIDEVVCGFRVHPRGAQGYFGVEADIATYGKVIGGGMPIGMVAGKREFLDALDGGFWQYGDDSVPEVGVTFFAGTFVRHPLALAGARACLEFLKENGPSIQENLNRKNEWFVGELKEIFRTAVVPATIHHFASWSYLSLPTDLRFGGLLYYFLRDKGVLWMEGFPLYLTLAHSDEDLNAVLAAFRESIAEMQSFELLPGTPSLAVAESTLEFPLTESQKEIWLSAHQSDEANCAFNESITLRLKGQVNEAALLAALTEAASRHQSLRATISENGETMRVGAKLNLPLDHVDARTLGDPERTLRETIFEHARRPFDLVNGPLIFGTWLRLADAEWALVLTAHHIVCDGWSTNVLLEELSTLYSASVSGTQASLEPAGRFSDYAQADRAKESSAEGKRAEEYWLAQFSEPVPLLDLPVDNPRPAVKSFDGDTCYFEIPADRYRKLRAAATQKGCTLYSYLFAGFEILLARLSNQSDLVIAIPTAGQANWEDGSLVGHCIHFLPLRRRLSPGASFVDRLLDAKKSVLEAYEYQEFTYGTLVQRLKLPRDPARLPLVEVQFNVERVGRAMKFPGLETDVRSNAKAFSNFDLFLNIVESDDGLRLQCDFNTRLIEKETLRRWLGHYEQLLVAAADNLATAWEKLPLLDEAGRAHLLLGGPAIDYPKSARFENLFRETAARNLNGEAVRFDGKGMTYRELDERSDALAAHLISRGAGVGQAVAVCVDRSAEMVVALLGVLKSGSHYIPLDPAYPRERISFIVEEAACPVVITQSEYREWFTGTAGSLVLTGNFAHLKNAPAPAVTATAADLAYTIYTSGSTGKPKGVDVSQRALVNFLFSMRQEPGITASDRLLAVTTISFDIAGLELFLPLLEGATAVIAGREETIDGNRLAGLIRDESISILQATPATWRLLLSAGWTGSPELKMLCGGEALPQDLAEQLRPLGRSLWNLYGPTETTIWSSIAKIEQGDTVTVGKPIANTYFYVVDAQGELAVPGVFGELLIGGDGVAEGYRNRPELTAEKFSADRFRGEGRLFRTGDVARRLADGCYEVAGRIDGQVKLRGFRIELGEIESALRRHPGVTDAAVVLREDSRNDKRLVAYFVNGAQKAGPGIGSGNIEHWQSVWEMLFSNLGQAGGSARDADAEISSWTRLGGSAAGHAEEWLNHSLQLVESLKPRRILELGCGTGQICLRVAPSCEEYWATDYSENAVRLLAETIGTTQPNVRTRHQAADDFTGIPENHFDVVLLNSVVQYFPNTEYLLSVIRGALKCLVPGGKLVLADMQPRALLDIMHAEQLFAQAPAGLSTGELREQIARRLETEAELSLDPAFILGLEDQVPGIAQISINLRRGKLLNEITRYHFDAVIWAGERVAPMEVPVWADFQAEIGSLDRLAERLEAAKAEAIGISGIPNARLAGALRTKSVIDTAADSLTVAELRARIPAEPGEEAMVDSLWDIAAKFGYTLDLRWAGNGRSGFCDAVFRPAATDGGILPVPMFPGGQMIDDEPVASRREHVAPPSGREFRTFLSGIIPDYMIPSAFVELEQLPRTPNGKLDRRSLPKPDATAMSSDSDYRAPSTPEETAMAAIWSEVLRVERVGVDDDIFALGGDSLLIFQIVTRAIQRGIPVKPKQVFEARTIARLVQAVAAQPAVSAAPRTIARVSREQYRRPKAGVQ